MSKISQYNLEIQELAEELGFSTPQDAFNAGYSVEEDKDGKLYLSKPKSALESVLDGLDDALQYMKSEEMYKKLDYTKTASVIAKLRDAERFILDNYGKLADPYDNVDLMKGQEK